MSSDPTRQRVLAHISAERDAQIAKWGRQTHPDGTSERTFAPLRDMYRAHCDAMARLGPEHDSWMNILREEFFEALSEEDPEALRKELIQLAAVATAWVEDIDERG